MFCEKIDFINYNSNPIYQIKECFKPKKIDIFRVHILEDGSIEAVIADDKISEAIGKGGMNIFLTKKLIGNGVHILKVSEYQEREREKVEKLAENLLEFNIDHDTATTILLKYSNLEDSLFDNSIDDDMKSNIRKYLDSLLEKERRNFIENGGNEHFFMSIPNIPSFVYTQLLQHNIFDTNDLIAFENADNLESITKLDIDICIMIMEYVKELENK